MEQFISDVFHADHAITETMLGSHEDVFDDSGVLVCDNCGRVILCGEDAAKLFCGRAADLELTSISDLLLEVSNTDMPVNRDRRSLAHLSTLAGKQYFNGVSMNGMVFPVTATIREILVDQIPLYLVRLFHATNAGMRSSPWAKSHLTETNIGR